MYRVILRVTAALANSEESWTLIAFRLVVLRYSARLRVADKGETTLSALVSRRSGGRREGYHSGKCPRGALSRKPRRLHVHPRGGGREDSRDRSIVLIEEDVADTVMR